MQAVQEAKANKTDLEDCLALVESVHERLKHLSIVQVEIARSMIPQKTVALYDKEEALNHKITRREFLLKQAQVTSQWVVDMPIIDPRPQVDEFSPEPAELLSPEPVPITVKQFEHYHKQVSEQLKQPECP